MKKKYIALLTALIMLFSLTPVTAMATDNPNTGSAAVSNREDTSSAELKTRAEEFAEGENAPPAGFAVDTPSVKKRTTQSVSDTCGKNLKWKIKNGTLTISGSGAMTEFDVEETPWNSKRTTITKIVIEEGCTSIGSFAFLNFTNLTSVEISTTVTKIGEAAFLKCSKLAAVTLPNVKILESAAFADCSNLKSVTANKLTTVNDYAFQKTALESYNFPATLKTISGLAFFKCDIETITVAANNKVFSGKDGVVYSNGGKTLYMYPTGAVRDTFVIPNTVTKIEKYSFSNNIYLTDVKIPKSVTYIGEGAFMNAASLKSVVIGDGVKSMGDWPFYNCLQVQSVTLGSGLKETPYQCFAFCESLTQIDFGTTVSVLGAQTFAYCNSLTIVELPKNIKEIQNGAFGCCEGLTKFSGGSLKWIPYQAFYGCLSLTDVVLNEGVENIYRVSFTGAESLKAITLPESVSFVHTDAFPADTKITCLNPDVEKYGSNGYRYLETVKINVYKNYDYAEAVLKQVNEKRKAAGLKQLSMSKSLTDAAMMRAGECAVLFSHTRPDGGSCFTVNSDVARENIAYGQSTAKKAMNSWMNSSGHKANILAKDVSTIGIGAVKHNGKYYWVQVFGTAKSSDKYAYPANKSAVQQIKICTEKFDEAETTDDIVWGDYAEYTYKMSVVINKSLPLTNGAVATAKLRVSNPGAPGVYAVLNNAGITWSSSNKNVATVSKTGKVTAVGAGKSTIKAKMKHYSASKKVTAKPKGTTISKIIRGKGQLTVKWNKCQQQVTGYQIRYTTSTTFEHYKTATVKNYKTTKLTLKKLKQGKKYYVKIRTFKTVNGVKYYSPWSKVKTGVVK